MPAKLEPKSYDEGIDMALTIAAEWGLALQERAHLLGYTDVVGDDPGFLQDQLKHSRRGDIWHHVEFVLEIKKKLDALFGNPDTINRWIRVKQRELHGRSVKDLLTGGTLADLEAAANTIGKLAA